ncbi:MAG: hypothetical protein JNK15_03235 [Planctomycetes bacterium]|nr:hypothetical protein [Planctomycetota bacterium]
MATKKAERAHKHAEWTEGDAPRWRDVVAELLDCVLVEVVPEEAERDLAKPGQVLVRLRGRERMTREEFVEATVADLRQAAADIVGAHEAEKLEAEFVREGFHLGPLGLARINWDRALRWALQPYRGRLATAKDRPGKGRHGADERRRFDAAADAIEGLLERPRITDEMVTNAKYALRCAIGRKAGPHGKTAPLGAKELELRVRAAAAVAALPNISPADLARVTGRPVSEVETWPEVMRARQAETRDPTKSRSLGANLEGDQEAENGDATGGAVNACS